MSPIALCKAVPGADGAVTLQKILRNSFHPFAPLEVTLAFSDQGPEYYKIHETYTVVASFRGKDQDEAKIFDSMLQPPLQRAILHSPS